MQITNWTKFFKEERDVYVQNISSTNLALEFRDHTGQPLPVKVENTRDPVNLTELVPFEIIKRSQDFRKMANRKPPVMLVLNEGEFSAYYQKKAELEGTADVEGVAARSMKAATDRDHNPPMLDPVSPMRTIPENLSANERAAALKAAVHEEGADSFVTEEDLINPRLLHVRQMVTRGKNSKGEDESVQDVMGRYPPQKCMNDIQSLGQLSEDNLNFILSIVPYKTIRKWAQGELQRINGPDEIDDEAVAATAPVPVEVLGPDGAPLGAAEPDWPENQDQPSP